MSSQKKKQQKKETQTYSKKASKFSEKDRAFAALEILQNMCLIRQGMCENCPIALKQTLEPMCIFEYLGISPGLWNIKKFDELEPLMIDDFYDEVYML